MRQTNSFAALVFIIILAIGAALAYAMNGDTAQAQKLTDQLNTEFPLDTMVQNYWLPSVHAALYLRKGDAKQAINALEVATPYELGSTNVSPMVPLYLRSLAYLKAGQGADAAAQFTKMLAHRGVAVNSPIEAMAVLQLARAQAASGDKTTARKSYQDFLSLWKQADPDLTVLQQAKAEYDHLRD